MSETGFTSAKGSVDGVGELLVALKRGGHLTAARVVRTSIGTAQLVFFVAASGAYMLPDDGFETALEQVINSVGPLSARNLKLSATMHKRVMRLLAREKLVTAPGRGYVAVWCVPQDARQRWLRIRKSE